jgi:hypothetical protein
MSGGHDISHLAEHLHTLGINYRDYSTNGIATPEQTRALEEKVIELATASSARIELYKVGQEMVRARDKRREKLEYYTNGEGRPILEAIVREDPSISCKCGKPGCTKNKLFDEIRASLNIEKPPAPLSQEEADQLIAEFEA